MAVIVNDMSEVNIDAALVQGGGADLSRRGLAQGAGRRRHLRDGGVRHLLLRLPRRSPVDPQKLFQWVRSAWPGVIRSKGFFWLATRSDRVGSWSQAGAAAKFEPAGRWWATAPKSQWSDDPKWRSGMAELWKPLCGDRRQELVLIGQGLDHAKLTPAFDACLVSRAQFALDPRAWARLPDPFRRWTTAEASA